MKSKRMCRGVQDRLAKIVPAAALVLAILGSSGARAAAWDAAADFSAAENANGPWSYGWSSTLGGAFELMGAQVAGQVAGWQGPAASNLVWKNFSPSVLHLFGTIYAAPGALMQHPGIGGQYSIVRWTAPAAGRYRVDTGFFGISESGQPTSTDVHVLLNEQSVFDGSVAGHWAAENAEVGPEALELDLEAGNTVDFAVGFGTGGYVYDSTRLDARISAMSAATAVPEPGSLGLALGGLGATWIGRRRRARAARIPV